MYPNVFAASRAIMDAAGVRGLFTGYLPTLLEDVPDMAFKFAAYESLRSLHRRANGGRNANAQVRAMLLSLDIFCFWLRFLEGILLDFSARWSQPQTFLKGSLYNLCCRVDDQHGSTDSPLVTFLQGSSKASTICGCGASGGVLMDGMSDGTLCNVGAEYICRAYLEGLYI